MRLCKNIVQPDRLLLTIRSMRIAYWLPKATNTHSEYVFTIVFSTERASMLRYIACPVTFGAFLQTSAL